MRLYPLRPLNRIRLNLSLARHLYYSMGIATNFSLQITLTGLLLVILQLNCGLDLIQLLLRKLSLGIILQVATKEHGDFFGTKVPRN